MIFAQIIFFALLCTICVVCENYNGVINSKRVINILSEKFLSVSVDPAILLSGIKISPVTQQLGRHLAPAYLRLAGPSTAYLRYDDADGARATDRITEATARLVVTPTSLRALWQWTVQGAHLTPVLALPDGRRGGGAEGERWDAGEVARLMEGWVEGRWDAVGECYWQVGCDNSNKTMDQYKEDNQILRNILDAITSKSDQWKISGSDMTQCIGYDAHSIGSAQEHTNNLDSITWKRTNKEDEYDTAEDAVQSIHDLPIHDLPVWTIAPKTNTPISFESAILWAKQIGDAAKYGFNVIFRQPRVHEFFTDTPPFWVSYFHKKLVGRTVLEVKMAHEDNNEIFTYAHCAKKQNAFAKSGAVTLLIINNSTQNVSVNLKITGIFPSSKLTYEVQSFLLESSPDDPSETLLNGIKLSLKNINKEKGIPNPNLRRARLNKNLNIDINSKSVGFYVLPGARLPACVSNEDEEQLIIKEITDDQKINLSEGLSPPQLKSRITERNTNLNELYQIVEQELESDEKLYKKQAGITNNPKQTLVDKIKEIKAKKLTAPDTKLILDIPKILEVKSVDQRVQDLKTKIKEKLESKKSRPNMDLLKNDMVKVPKERGVSKLDKSKGFFEDEIDDFILKSVKMMAREKRNIKMGRKRFNTGLNKGHKHLYTKAHRPSMRRPRRAINMDLLQTKAKPEKSTINSNKPLFSQNAEIKATFREPGQTSIELLAISSEEEDDEIEEKIPFEIFAEMAKPEVKDKKATPLIDYLKVPKFSWDDSFLRPKVDFAGIFNLPKLKPILSKPIETKEGLIQSGIQDNDKYLSEMDSLDSLEDDGLDKYHGFFEHIGDSVSTGKSSIGSKGLYKDGSDLDNEEKKLKETLNTLLENEFYVNHNDKAVVDDTIHKLEEFFKDEHSISEDTNIFASDSLRKKREVKEYTEDDITFYKKLMQSNIKHMREQMMKNRIRGGRDLVGLQQKFFQPRSSNTKVSEKNKDKLEDIRIESQKKLLKNRLNVRKKLEEKRSHTKNLDQLLSKLRSKSFKDGLNNLRKKRSTLHFDEVYEPKVELQKLLKVYEPLLSLMQKSNVENDIKPKKYAIEITDDNPSSSIPKPPKAKRHITKEDEWDMFQDISHIFNVIEKDSEILTQYLDQESGEYEIILPSNHEVRLVNDHGLTELEFVHRTETSTTATTTNKPYDPYTCTASYDHIQTTESVETMETIEEIATEQMATEQMTTEQMTTEQMTTEYIDVWIGDEVTDVMTELNIESTTAKASNIARIDKVQKQDIIEQVFGKFRAFVDTIGETVKKYVNIFHVNKPQNSTT